jgi:hypothetical protein
LPVHRRIRCLPSLLAFADFVFLPNKQYWWRVHSTSKLARLDLGDVLTRTQMAEAGQVPVNTLLSFGLREVVGTKNNLVPARARFSPNPWSYRVANRNVARILPVHPARRETRQMGH